MTKRKSVASAAVNPSIYKLLDRYHAIGPSHEKTELPNRMLHIIQTGEFDARPNRAGVSPTMLAITAGLGTVALALIQSGKSIPDHVSPSGETALDMACLAGEAAVALALIQTGKSKPGHLDSHGNTALMYACGIYISNPGMAAVISALIRTGQSKPGHIDSDNNSILTFVCGHRFADVALQLIQTGHSNPGHVDNDGNTALLLACKSHMHEVALRLIDTGESNPGHIDNQQNTALSLTCFLQQPSVALALVETDQVDINHRNLSGMSAIELATMSKLWGVVTAIQIRLGEIANPAIIDLNSDGFNPGRYDHIQVRRFLSESSTNMCFVINRQVFLTSKYELNRQMNDPRNIKFGCFQAGETQFDVSHNMVGIDYTDNANIDYDTEYLSLSSLFGLQILVKASEIDDIVDSPYASNVYSAVPENNILPAIISNAYIDGADGSSADHCQSGKPTEVYRIVRATLDCIKSRSRARARSGSGSESESRARARSGSRAATSPIHAVNIQYKTDVVSVQVNPETTTIGQLKADLLAQLIALGKIDDSPNKTVRLIFKGHVYKDDENGVVLSSLANPLYGITLQAMITEPVGGKSRRRRNPPASAARRRSARIHM